MKADKTTARIVGALYVVGTVAGVASLVSTGPVRDAQDLLAGVPAGETRLVVGALFVLTMGLALAMVPVVMFPVLRRHNEALALGYVVLRGGLEAAAYLAVATGWLLLVPLSRAYAQAGASGAPDGRALGTVLLEAREIGSVLTVVFCLGALVFYYLLYRTGLVPRWLSGWGLVAVAPFLAAGLLAMFGVVDALSPIYNVLNLPLALQEMVLAVWLIVKGFDPSATVLGTAKTEPNGVQTSTSGVV
ncbi:MAG: DUF4386 domain-containing protein [Actinomycetota bacterium]|nr:DUF4386 domain-containing protein [Actinomycetota bacterium]